MTFVLVKHPTQSSGSESDEAWSPFLDLLSSPPSPTPRAIDVLAPTFNKTLVCLDLIDDYTLVRY